MKQSHPRSLILMSLYLITSCTVGPNYVRPELQIPPHFKESSPWKIAEPHDDIDRGHWWEIYQDPLLNDFETKVSLNNQNIKASEMAWQQAQAIMQASESALFPQLALSSGLNRSGTGGKGTKPVNKFTVTASGGWAIDLWGKLRRTLEETEATAMASRAELASAQLSMQATFATDYFLLRIQDNLKLILQQSIEANQKSLTIVRNQYEAGIATKADVLASQTQLESLEASLLNVDVLRQQLEHALAVLMGEPPSSFSLSPLKYMPTIPPLPEFLPSDLLERRPDIAAAERKVAAANAEIGVQESGWFPSLTLSGSAGVSSTALNALTNAPSFLWSFGPSLTQTLFDAGTIEAQVDSARANYYGTVASYRQTVLTALQQVEDNLSTLRILSEQASIERETVSDAHQTEQLTFNQYKEGTLPLINVLSAETTTLSSEENALQVSSSRLVASVALIEALGGNWKKESRDQP